MTFSYWSQRWAGASLSWLTEVRPGLVANISRGSLPGRNSIRPNMVNSRWVFLNQYCWLPVGFYAFSPITLWSSVRYKWRAALRFNYCPCLHIIHSLVYGNLSNSWGASRKKRSIESHKELGPVWWHTCDPALCAVRSQGTPDQQGSNNPTQN